MKVVLCIGLGGFVGAVSRHYLAVTIDRWVHHQDFPWGIFCANVIGCLLIGLLMGVSEQVRMLSEEMRLLLVSGFLGSLTTFSTFSFNTFELFRKGDMLTGLANIGLSMVFGLTAVWLGYQVALLGVKQT